MTNRVFISLCVLGCLAIFQQKVIFDLKSDLKSEKDKYKVKHTLLEKTAERALKWELYAFKLDEITDKYQSSRKAKRENKELLELGTSLNFDYE